MPISPIRYAAGGYLQINASYEATYGRFALLGGNGRVMMGVEYKIQIPDGSDVLQPAAA